MNKTFLITLFTICSLHSFSQSDTGGAAGGGPDVHPVSQPSPVAFKRNNGNGSCGGEAEIRIAFTLKPDYAPTIERITYEGQILPVVIGEVDTTMLSKKGYISYCITSGNIPPANKIDIKLRYIQSNQTFWMSENK